MPMLDMREAAFCREKMLLRPLTVMLEIGERADVACETSLAAGVAARLAAGIMKCTTGVVFIGNFDPKIQPVQVKRLAGFVAQDRPRGVPDARAYFAYRAALWELNAGAARARGAALLRRFDGLPNDEAIALAGALLHRPALIVLDRPTRLMREAAAEAAREAALFAVYGPADRAVDRSTVPLELVMR